MKLALAAVSLLILAATGCGDTGTPTPATTAAAVPSAPAVKPAPGDHVTGFVDSTGKARDYIAHAPPTYTSGKRYPLVMVFHGQPSNAADMPGRTGMNQVADAHGFLVVYPDQTFLPEAVGELIDHFVAIWGADPKRVHATGFSRGATLMYELAEKLPGRFGAIAPVSGGRNGERPLPQPVSLLTFQGSLDRLAPGWTITNNSWAKAAGCGGEKVTSITMEGGPAHIYTSTCAGGHEHIVYTITQMGHSWPADASRLIWQFFAKHPLP